MGIKSPVSYAAEKALYALSYDGGKRFGELSADQQKALRSWRSGGKKGAPPVSIDNEQGKKQSAAGGKPSAPVKGIGSYKTMRGLKGAVTRARNGGASDAKIAERLKAKGVEDGVLEKLGLVKGERPTSSFNLKTGRRTSAFSTQADDLAAAAVRGGASPEALRKLLSDARGYYYGEVSKPYPNRGTVRKYKKAMRIYETALKEAAANEAAKAPTPSAKPASKKTAPKAKSERKPRRRSAPKEKQKKPVDTSPKGTAEREYWDAWGKWKKLVELKGGDPNGFLNTEMENRWIERQDEPELLRQAQRARDEARKRAESYYAAPKNRSVTYAAPKNRSVTYAAFAPANYKAEQQPDGNYTIYNVPIFAEHERNGVTVDRAWLERAVERDRQRRKERYAAPTHVEHTGGPERPSRAGHFELTRVGRDRYEGKERWVLYANITDVPPDVFAQIKRGELPYRSPEVHDLNDPEINSLALMASEVPYFRFAVLTAEEAKPTGKPVTTYKGKRNDRDVARFVYACGRDQYQEKPMNRYEEGGDDMKAMLEAVMKRLDALEAREGDVTATDEMTASEAEDTAEEAMADEAAADVEMSDDEIDAMLAEDEADEDEADEDEDEAKYRGTPPKREKVGPAEIYQAKADAKYSALVARVDALESENRTLKAKEDRREWTLKAINETKHLGIDKAEITKYAAKSGEVRDTWLETVKAERGARSMPPARGSYTAAAIMDEGKEVAQYSAFGHEAMVEAANLKKEWERRRQQGSKATLETYLAANHSKGNPKE